MSRNKFNKHATTTIVLSSNNTVGAHLTKMVHPIVIIQAVIKGVQMLLEHNSRLLRILHLQLSLRESNTCQIKMSKQSYKESFQAKGSKELLLMKRLLVNTTLTSGAKSFGRPEHQVKNIFGIVSALPARKDTKLLKH